MGREGVTGAEELGAKDTEEGLGGGGGGARPGNVGAVGLRGGGAGTEMWWFRGGIAGGR